jgi:protein-S-isoprenylcysteine O-methyltransferase Ste14
MTTNIRMFLLIVGNALALILGYLGWVTRTSNWLGWFLLVIGLSYVIGGTLYFGFYQNRAAIAYEESSDRSFWLILPGFLVVFFGAPLEYLYLPVMLPRTITMQVIGLVLIGASILLRIWTRLALRGMYTGHVQVQEGHRLVREGPYRFARHPGYTGFVLMALGLGLGYSSLIGLVAIPVLMLPGLAYRMTVEEKLLTEKFSDEYRQYARTVKRLIPGIW